MGTVKSTRIMNDKCLVIVTVYDVSNRFLKKKNLELNSESFGIFIFL